jgi:hypothetical protein
MSEHHPRQLRLGPQPDRNSLRSLLEGTQTTLAEIAADTGSFGCEWNATFNASLIGVEERTSTRPGRGGRVWAVLTLRDSNHNNDPAAQAWVTPGHYARIKSHLAPGLRVKVTARGAHRTRSGDLVMHVVGIGPSLDNPEEVPSC